jgi:hypothetical protein
MGGTAHDATDGTTHDATDGVTGVASPITT